MTNPKSPIRNRVDIRVDIGLTRTWPSRYVIEKIGGRGGARTPDPLLAKQALSQLSYTPTLLISKRLFFNADFSTR
jgi:hypothetical protein